MIYISFPKRKQKKPNAAQRQLAADWDALLKKHKPKPLPTCVKVVAFKPAPPIHRSTPKIPSLNSGFAVGPASKPEKKVYTGTNIIGIATLHKSNAVPVFSNAEAIEIANMRRG